MVQWWNISYSTPSPLIIIPVSGVEATKPGRFFLKDADR